MSKKLIEPALEALREAKRMASSNDVLGAETQIDKAILYVSNLAARNEVDPRAEQIWNLYPPGRKVGKPHVLRLITKCLKEFDFDFLMDRTKQFANACKMKERQFICHPSTFFGPQQRFNDDPSTWSVDDSVIRKNKEKEIEHIQEKMDSLQRRYRFDYSGSSEKYPVQYQEFLEYKKILRELRGQIPS